MWVYSVSIAGQFKIKVLYSLEIKQLSYKSHQDSLLRDTRMIFEQGKIYGLRGASGIGKSSLLMSLAGLQATECIANFNWLNNELPRISFMSQQPEYTLSPIHRVGVSLEDVFKAHADYSLDVESVLEYCSLSGNEELLNRYPHQCSGGELQRVILAMSIFQMPDLLLLDEPTAGIDQLTARSILRDIQAWVRENDRICFIASHDENLLSKNVDLLFEINKQKLVPVRPSLYQVQNVIGQEQNQLLTDATTRLENSPIYQVTDGVFTFEKGNEMLSFEVDLEIYRNEIVGLTGMSGAGKSTIGKLIAGHLQWKSGSESICFRQVQYLSQDPVQNFHPYKIMKFQLHPIYKRWEHLWSTSFKEVLQILQIEEEWMDRTILGLSGGQRQRMLIARALLCKPDLLIIDESFSGLDGISKYKLWKWIEYLRMKWSFSILVITHDLNMIDNVCDHIFILHDGKIVDKLDNFGDWEKKATHTVTKRLINAYI